MTIWAMLIVETVNPLVQESDLWSLGLIPDASRRPPLTPQDFGCISFFWGLSREICQKVDVVWFEQTAELVVK